MKEKVQFRGFKKSFAKKMWFDWLLFLSLLCFVFYSFTHSQIETLGTWGDFSISFIMLSVFHLFTIFFEIKKGDNLK